MFDCIIVYIGMSNFWENNNAWFVSSYVIMLGYGLIVLRYELVMMLADFNLLVADVGLVRQQFFAWIG